MLEENTQKNSLYQKIAWVILISFLTGGILAHILPPINDQLYFKDLVVDYLTEPLLFSLNIFLLAWVIFRNYADEKFFKLLGWLGFSWVITFLLEIIGVFTGLVFGDYVYGSVFKLQILEVPLVIAFNWVLLSLGAILIVDNLLQKIKPKNLQNDFLDFFYILTSSVLVALLLGFFDWILEPVAIELDYWQWESLFIPLQNYLAWMAIGFFLTLFYHFLGLKVKAKLVMYSFWIQLIFLAILNFLLTVF